MQLTVHMTMFNVSFPANTLFFYGTLKEVSSFEVLPSQKIHDILYEERPDVEKMPMLFLRMGYENYNIADNLGSLMLYLQGWIVLAGLGLIIKILGKFSSR